MEKQLFSWGDWSQDDAACFTYYDVELKVAIGDYPIGNRFDEACIDYGKGELQFFSQGGLLSTHKLELKIL